MSETRVPVLIVGGGSVGLFTAVFLAQHGIAPLLVEGAAGPSIHPRATGLGPRTMEFLRQVGLADEVDAVAVDMSAGSLGKISGSTLAAVDLSAVPDAPPIRTGWGSGRISPAMIRGICAQDRLDRVLAPAAAERGATLRFSTRLSSFEQDAEGVTAHLDDGTTVRADYLIAADGVRSGIRDALGIEMTGPGTLGNPKVSMLFRADLRPYTHGRHFANCDITGPDAFGMLVTVDGAKEWIFHTDYHPENGESVEDFTNERCVDQIRTAVGDPALEVEVLSRLPWSARGLLADRFGQGRVFLVGDAAHAVPPQGAFGLNTGAADAHNLAWKLAAVLHGQAGPVLLKTYETERRSVASYTLEQALLRVANPRLHWDMSPTAGVARAAVGMAAAPVVQLGYRYDSAAVIDADPRLPDTEDVELVLDGTPGSRLPHLWIDEGRSTLDLVRSEFALLAGPGGEAWVRAAQEAAARLGMPLVATVLEASDWPGRVGITADGAVLVRPDQVIAWRAPTAGADPAETIGEVLRRVLDR
ncbi:FAD-dependent monooxygenase [Nocardia sp. NPDC051052]|uniref:FAD-dependent monooxygenase n=1 Tax=Nocardia sp. NPDC051052 TaxID=3364322 RepID=UPI0037A97B4F